MNAALFSIDSFGGLTFSSTFTAGTFQLTNNSDTQDIVSITLDLRDAIFPDLVFDPNGEAGDSTARGFQFDSQNDAGNTIEITNFPFANAAAPFSSPHDGGFDVLTINFDRFEPGQTLRFSTDVDPTSIKGSNDPGPSDSGSISGLELVGATITVTFADDTELTGQVYRTPNSDSGSEVSLTPTTTAAPEISAIGFDAAATVGDANQTIRVEGNAGAEVSLLVLEGAFYTEANGGFDADPFEANTAIAVSEITATIGANGSVDVPVNLTRTDAADGGLNYIVAKYQDGNSLVSDRLVLEYAPGTTNPDPNPNTPAGTIRIQAEDYNAGTNGEEYFDFDADVNLGGAYRPNEGVDIEAASDVGGGFNVAFIQDGEFLTYDVNVPEAGTYNVMLRVATPSEDTQTAEVTINGQTYTASFDFTGGWQEYTDVLVTNVSLAAGTQEIRFDARSSMFNFNYIDLVAAEPGDIVDTAVPTAVLNTTALTKQVDGVAPANFTITYSDDRGINNNTIDANDVTVTAPDGTEIPVTLVEVDRPGNGSPITATYAIAAPGGSWDGAEAGDYTIALGAGEVSDVNGKNAAAGVLGTLSLFVAGDGGETPTNPNPNPEVPAGTIRIEAEDYKAGTNGTEYFDFDVENLGGAIRLTEPVDIQDADDVGGGYNVAFIQDGEFLTYDVNVAEAGTYDVVLRVATPSADTQTAEVTINGQTYTASFDFTGGWQEYTNVLVTNVELEAGIQELRIDARSSEFNFNYIDLVGAEQIVDEVAPTAVLNTTSLTKQADGVSPANFTVTYSDNNAIAANTIDANDVTVTAPDGTEIAVELVSVDTPGNGSPITATYAIAVPGGTWDATDAGDYTINLKEGEVSDPNGNSVAAGDLGTLNLFVAGVEEPPVTPPVTPPSVGNSIRIEAEDYRAGINGIDYLDTSRHNFGGAHRNDNVDIEATGDVDGGYNISWIQAGEFLTYDIDVPQAGTYDVVLRVATPAENQSLNLVVGGEATTAEFGSTGGWQTYEDVVVSGVNLEAGSQELRLIMNSNSFNLNYFELIPQTVVEVDNTAPTATLNTTVLTQQPDSEAAAVFTVTYSDNNAIAANTIDANDVTVIAPDGTELEVTLVSVDTAGDGTPRTATYAIAAPGGTWDVADNGEYTVTTNQGEIADVSGNLLEAIAGSLTINVPEQPPTDVETIRIEAEDYKAGTNGTEYFDFDADVNLGGEYRPTEGVDIEVTGDVEDGFNVAFIQDGEFLTYDVDVAEASTYNVVLRVATPSEDTQSAEVTINGETYTTAFGFTGGWQEYTDVTVANVNLAAGTQEIRFDARSSMFNFNYIELVPAEPGEVDSIAPTAVLNTASLTKQPNGTAPANFTLTFSDNAGINVNTIDNGDVSVTAPNGTELAANLVSIDANTNGTPRSATYSVQAPGGTWDATDAGSYNVSLNAGQVADTSGNLATAGAVGNFNIFVAPTPDDNAIRINAGATTNTVDANNKTWLADVNFAGGQASTVGDAIENTVDDFIYQSQRAGDNFSYSIPVEDGNYQVNLYFAELDFDNSGQRQFDVALEGETVLDNYDIWQDTKNAFLDGGDTAKVVQISDLSVIRDGAIDLNFNSVANNATIAGIEIVPIEGAQVFIIESDDSTLVTEGGNSDTYQVLLNSQPTANVTINLQPDNQSSVNQNTLVFTPQNWSVPQTVTVNAVDDNNAESFSHGSAIAHTISTTDAAYSNINIPNVNLQVTDNDVSDAEIKFDIQDLGIDIGGKTTATWGPDGRLYVGTRGGTIEAYTFDDNYNITNTQTISTLEGLSNNNILGLAFNPFENDGSELKLYVSHSELEANKYTYPKEGGSGFNELVDFSPYSGEVSILSGANFSQQEILVDNIGVSNHDHGVNGLAFDGNGDLLITVGSNTNAGIADDDIGGLDESPFTAAILKAEITKPNFNGNIQYQLPADWVAPEGLQISDPVTSQGFGGIVDVVPGTDVSVYAPGLRNPYDLVYSTRGIVYATENNANSGFGDYSIDATTQENFDLNPLNELNIIEEGNYYGNPNRNRGREDDRQNTYYPSYAPSNGEYTAPIGEFDSKYSSVNGIAEYRSTTFSEQLRGNLLAIDFDHGVQSIELSGDGRQVENIVEDFTGADDNIKGLDVLTGFGGSIIGINYFGGGTVAIPDDDITTATAYEIDEWRAPASGGGTFTIGGTNFSNLNDTTVTIGDETAEIIRVSEKRIFGTLPAFDAAEYANDGLLDITVTSGGDTSVIADAFQPLFVQRLILAID